MIYPIDVHSNVVNTRKLVGRDRTAVIIQLFLFANIGLFFLLRFIFGQLLQMDMAFAWIAQIVICVICGIFIFRVFIFKEDEKVREYESSDSDSFSKYLNIRKDSEYHKVVAGHDINLYEFTNGCASCVICCKFGSNDNSKANSTAQLLNTLVGLIYTYNYEIRFVSLPEKFENSKEFKQYINSVNAVEDIRLGKALRQVADCALNVSKNKSNVDAIYIVIKTDTTYKRGELENVVSTFFKQLDETVTSFRSVNTLDMDELLEFFRDFSTVEALDISMTKALDMIDMLDTDYAKAIGIYSFSSDEGKTLCNDKVIEAPFYSNERSITYD